VSGGFVADLLSAGLEAAGAAAVVYVCGYVTGSLLVAPAMDRTLPSLAIVRLVAGLLLTSVSFLLSLALALPWFTGPVVLAVIACVSNRRSAFALPRPTLRFTWDGALAGVFAVVVLAPVFVASARMAPGDFPHVFFNVDTPYFLEKIHALVNTSGFPPESLGVAGGRPAYHLGIQGVAAVIVRTSGMAPHHVTFLIVLPLLACGIAAAAVLLWRGLAPAVPAKLAVPLLLTTMPTLWYPFWHVLGSDLRAAVTAQSFEPLSEVFNNLERWGVVNLTGTNLVAHFLVLASVGAVVAAPTRGWRLPVLLIGTAVIFKAPTGIVLAAGFSLAQFVRAALGRSLRPLLPVAAVTLVFAVTYAAFWIVPSTPVEYRTELYAWHHLKNVQAEGRVAGFIADIGWLLLPALVVLPAAIGRGASTTLPFLAFAATPFLLVNSLRGVDLRPGRGIDSDWLQVLMPTAILARVFVLGLAQRAWGGLGAAGRVVFALAVALAVLPPAIQAARYAGTLIMNPANGHEFADNRAIAAALRAIPVEKSIIVTNDLRYPADGFARDNRQLQIPALFGHQAFAVNYAYEEYAFSRDRRALQELIRKPEWSPAIDQAAREHGWTHLLIRKDYLHPSAIPLERVFENDSYLVFRF
jgi:hypothetical protein